MTLTREMESELRAISRRCFRRAAESFGILLGRPVGLAVTGISSLPPAAIPSLVGPGDGQRLAAIQFEVNDKEGGRLLIVFPFPAILQLMRRLLPEAAHVAGESFSAMEVSAVQEVGNILASTFLTELGDLLGRRILLSPPRVHLEDVDDLIREISRDLGEIGSEVVVVQAKFEEPASGIEGRFFVFPGMTSLTRVLSSAEG